MHPIKKIIPVLLLMVLAGITVMGQRADTSSARVVTITSAFKPSLKNAAKLNFTAASPLIDSSRTPVVYNIPSQNLLFSYQPVPLKPLALAVDTSFTWNNDHYIKAGAGNFSNLLLQGGFSFGDGKKSITNILAGYTSAKGNLPAQQFAKLSLGLISVFNTNRTNEWTAKANYENRTQYFYGFEPATLPFTKDALLQRFNTAGIEIGLQNKAPNAFNISYHPQVNLQSFSDNRDGREFRILAKAPLRKTFGRIYAFDLGVTADISTTTLPGLPNKISLKNNLFYVSPSVLFLTPNFQLSAGILPSWDNSAFSALPNITAEVRIGQSNFRVEAGWVGYFNKHSYQSLSSFNPWIDQPSALRNTKVREQYGGIKGSAGNHLTYRARVSFMRWNNQPLFLNSSGDGRKFSVVYDPEIQVVKLHGELGYTVQEKLSVIAAATYQQFTSLQFYDKAYGLLPLEFTGTVKWHILKDLQLKADAFIWDGSRYFDRLGNTGKLDAVADINFGVEFAVMRKLNVWLQLNNVLNTKYQRWNQYEVLGLNVLGGIVYSLR